MLIANSVSVGRGCQPIFLKMVSITNPGEWQHEAFFGVCDKEVLDF